ncbi:hypothetical protein [Mycobacterium paraffinicum]|uniref:Uncharacterized protein n=1 Tax=Mycobacterium paraffinicum TaxID=53378 RepID=A0ABP8F6P8_9MYCO
MVRLRYDLAARVALRWALATISPAAFRMKDYALPFRFSLSVAIDAMNLAKLPKAPGAGVYW